MFCYFREVQFKIYILKLLRQPCILFLSLQSKVRECRVVTPHIRADVNLVLSVSERHKCPGVFVSAAELGVHLRSPLGTPFFLFMT